MRVVAVMAVVLAVALLSNVGMGSTLGYEARFSFTLLGLGADLTGVYYDGKDWMILVGRGGLVAEAKRVDGIWTYKLVSYGGKNLESLVWSGESGLAVGEGRVVQIERHEYVTVREVPFLSGKFVRASWSMDGSFAMLMTRDGKLYTYRPGESSALEVRASNVKTLVSIHERYPQSIGIFLSEVETNKRSELRPYVVLSDGQVAPLNETEIEHRDKVFGLIERLMARYPGYSGVLTISIKEGLLLSFNENVVEVDDGERVSRLTLAFKVLGVYSFEGTTVVVGEFGGIAIIQLNTLSVKYVSIPSADRVYFTESDVAVITSGSGLFIYHLRGGSVEYIPMPYPPTAFLPEENIVADAGGRIYRLVRPEPWKGGLTLLGLIEDGYVSDIVKSKEGALLLVRKAGRAPEETRLMLLNSAGLKTLNASKRLAVEKLSYISGKGETLITGSAVYLLGEVGLLKLQVPQSTYYKAAWHPSGCLAVIPGSSSKVLVYVPHQHPIKIPVEGSRDLLSASWSSDGKYALIGGAGVLYAFDGANIVELELPYVVTFRDIAASPSSELFLATTSLGLLLIEGSYSPRRPLTSFIEKAPIGPDTYRLRVLLIPHRPYVAETLHIESRVPTSLTSQTLVRELAPSCHHRLSADVKLGKEFRGGVVELYLDTESGKVYVGSIMLEPLTNQSSLIESFGTDNLLILIIPLLIVAIIMFRRIRRRISAREVQRRVREQPQNEDSISDVYWSEEP